MRRCQNCYNSFLCKCNNPLFYEKHVQEGQTTCLRWEDDSVNEDEE